MSANWKYRQQLIKNADEIIKLNQTFKCSEQPTFSKTTDSTTTPFLYTSCVDNTKPIGYQTSNMKEQFLQRREKQCTMMAPEIHLK